MMLNSKPVDALAMVVHRNAAVAIGRTWTKKLRKLPATYHLRGSS